MFDKYKYIVVGSGFFGSVVAERIASVLGKEVLILEKNNHIGGKCHSQVDNKTGIEYHTYGTHIFHTSNQEVWNYIQQFTGFNSYYHQVLTTYKDKVYQMPINLETINSFYNVNLKPYEVGAFLESKRGHFDSPRNFEETAINLIGEDLYKAFIRGYTMKQWGTDPVNLPGSIIKRLPVRNNYNESYFFDRWQGIPIDGYAEIFNRMLDNLKINVVLNTDYFEIKDQIPKDAVLIYTGAIDKFFDYKFGELEWRSLRFETEVVDYQDFQGTSVMNYADEDIPYTRIHEPKHLHPEREVFNKGKTLIIKEYSCIIPEDPYYPVSNPRSKEIFELYRKEGQNLKNVIIGGRLGDYKYYDMHHTIEKALEVFNTLIK
jgi:UDP-galactopyranose mutase